MGLFDRKPKALPSGDPAPREHREESVSLSDANDVNDRIAAGMKKSMTYAGYVAWDNADDTGGYFGPEFDIKSTAGRIKGLYSREPWIYTTSTRVSQTLSTIPFRVYQPNGGDVIENHPLGVIFNGGTAAQSAIETHWTSYLDLMLGGNYFLVMEEDFKSIKTIAPVELVNLRYSKDFSRVEAIEVTAMGGQTTGATFPMEQVIHVKLPNPYGFFYGMSPFASAARPILLDRYKNEYEMAFYLRGATYGGVIETTEDLGKARFQRMTRTFEQANTGRANWWRTLFLPKGAKWQAATQTMSDMQHLEGLRENRLTILATIGVPPSIVGITQDVNRATSEAQERTYWNQTVVPMAWFIASGWNNSFLVKTKFKGKIELRPDFSGVEAVEGFASARSERAKGMEPYYWIDEIRSKVWGDEPLPNGAGEKFAAEVKGAGVPGALALAVATPATKDLAAIGEGLKVQTVILDKAQFSKSEADKWVVENGFKNVDVDETSESWRYRQENPDDFEIDSMKTVVLRDGVKAVVGKPKVGGKSSEFLRAKAAAVASQNRVESTLGTKLKACVERYVAALVADAVKALDEKRHVREYLTAHQDTRLEAYMLDTRDVYAAAMERGFSLAFSQVKTAPTSGVKRAGFPGLSDLDRQAADILRERTRDGQRKVLYQRAITRFEGFDANRTDAIVGIIEQGYRDGLGFEEIARSLRDKYDEAYRNQARTIVRTEILSAVSEGLNWNHKVLTDIFSDVLKEWLHQGDDNKDARQEHVDLDGEQVSGDGAWTVLDPGTGQQVVLAYPRDPSAPAGQTTNCRCTMVSVIPDNATSNAESIVEQGG